MKKKDYELIANILKYAKDNELVGSAVAMKIIKLFAEQMNYKDPKFDRDRFLEACGISSETLVVDTANKTVRYED